MNHYDPSLKMYATRNIRTAEDWTLQGRQVNTDAKACVQSDSRGINVPLYTRQQTSLRPAARRGHTTRTIRGHS